MNRSPLLPVLGIVLLLLVVAGGAYWYFFSGTKITAAELVPGDSVAFATIPNGKAIVDGYQTSHLKALLDSPNAQPLIVSFTNLVGQKTVDVLKAFGPNLTGPSLIAITHVNVDKLAEIGFVAAMKPKNGMADFNAFVDQLKTAWPDVIKQGTTGTGNVLGVDYQWIKGPDAQDKICVAQVGGWIVTTWGEASLQDWIERYQKKSATPSLATNPDYQKSLTRIGKDPMAVLYINYHAVLDLMQKQATQMNPAAGDYLAKKLASVGGAAVGTRFENGEIVDRFSFLISPQTLAEGGFGATACPFETIKFTGPNTFLYWASSINVQQYWKNLQEMPTASSYGHSTFYPSGVNFVGSVQAMAQTLGLDFQHNFLDPLGTEISLQGEWSADAPFPELGLLVKLDKPDDFKATEVAAVEAVRKANVATAVIRELNSNGQTLEALKFIKSSPLSPTITEGGDYLGLFSTEGMAVRTFQRDVTVGLPHDDDFARQIGDKRNGASQILFLDSPQLLDHAYRAAQPYLSLASMFSPQLAGMLKGKNLPPDLDWLAPMGTWSYVMTPDAEGLQAYSLSGIGNQGFFLAGAVGGATEVAQMMGLIPKAPFAAAPPRAPAITPVVPPTSIPAPAPDAVTSPNAPAEVTTPPAPASSTTPPPDMPVTPTAAPVPSAPAPLPSSTTTAPVPAPPVVQPATNAPAPLAPIPSNAQKTD